MIDSVASGENVFAYNQIGSYARRVADNPDVGVIMPSDYTLVMSRVAFIPAKAPHPNAGKLWLDYLLSQRGQTIVMNQAGLYSLRSDVDGEFSAATLTKQLGTALKPIPISPEILETLDKTFISEFLAKWKAAVRG
jgi:iron(III) transport system substrate-binding protein